jgi:hypothetical protein
MLYQIESEFLSPDSRQMLAKILAEHFAGEADRQEREAQAALRALADTRPPADERIRTAVEADKTPYVSGVRGRRRTVPVTVPVILTSPPTPTETAAQARQEPSAIAPIPQVPRIEKGFFARLREWSTNFQVYWQGS